MNIEFLEQIVLKNLVNENNEFKRVFHGRGGMFEGFEFLTIDIIDKVLFVVFFSKIDEVLEKNIFDILFKIYNRNELSCIILQRRYVQKAQNEVLYGELPLENYAYENGLKYKLNLLSNQNHGFFADMSIGRNYVKENSKDKNVLNLFSYTCVFSACAIKGGAKAVVNVDMSKGALSTGRENHRINDLDTKKVQFMPYNILKSWNRIKKAGPYDLIIIDPPTFQKGSFAASKDYNKIIKKLSELASSNCTVLSALNSPELNSEFIKDIFSTYASEFKFIKRLKNLDTFPSLDEEKSLKNLIFKN